MERRTIDARIVEAAAASGLESSALFAQPAEREAFEARLTRYLEAAYPETLPVRIEWVHDEEHSRFTPTVRLENTAVQRTLEFDQTLLESPDYQRFVALAEHARNIGSAPYKLVTGGEASEIATPRQLLAELLRLAS